MAKRRSGGPGWDPTIWEVLILAIPILLVFYACGNGLAK